ncbi:MAG: CBS domain-containing protein [Sulfitobacter pontiacus]|jgi:CBS domain-containing protein
MKPARHGPYPVAKTKLKGVSQMEIAAAMHQQADWASADMPVSEVAKLMQKTDIGAIPIGRDDKLIGMVTDRDIALRVVAEGRDPAKTTAEEIMTKGIVYCQTTETVEDAIHLMDQKKIRRLPVIDNNKRLAGMLSLGDISHAVGRELSGELLRAVADHHP